MSICFLKAGKYSWWISYEIYCLKVSLSKKLILSQFPQKEITIFFMKTKTKNRKRKILPTVCLPHTYFKKKNVLNGLILGRKRKNL